jgi:hypothetical protein
MGCSKVYGRQDRLRRRPEQWLQSTFANRYHKFRTVHDKLFTRQAARWAPARHTRAAGYTIYALSCSVKDAIKAQSSKISLRHTVGSAIGSY